MPAFVKNVGTAAAGNATTNAITVPAQGVAKGNFVIVRTNRASSGVTVSSVTDTGSNTYTKLAEETTQQPSTSLWIALVTTALVSANTITTTFSDKGANASSADEFSGLYNLKDVSTTSNSAGTTTPTATIALAGKVDLIIGAVGINAGSSDSFTEDTDDAGGDTWHSLTAVANGSNDNSRSAYKLTLFGQGQTYNPTLGTSRAVNELLVAIHSEVRNSTPNRGTRPRPFAPGLAR